MRICPKCKKVTLTYVLGTRQAVCMTPDCPFQKKVRDFDSFRKKFKAEEILPKALIYQEASPPTEEIFLAERLYAIMTEESLKQGLFDPSQETSFYNEIAPRNQCMFRSAARYVLANYNPKGM